MVLICSFFPVRRASLASSGRLAAGQLRQCKYLCRWMPKKNVPVQSSVFFSPWKRMCSWTPCAWSWNFALQPGSCYCTRMNATRDGVFSAFVLKDNVCGKVTTAPQSVLTHISGTAVMCRRAKDADAERTQVCALPLYAQTTSHFWFPAWKIIACSVRHGKVKNWATVFGTHQIFWTMDRRAWGSQSAASCHIRLHCICKAHERWSASSGIRGSSSPGTAFICVSSWVAPLLNTDPGHLVITATIYAYTCACMRAYTWELVFVRARVRMVLCAWVHIFYCLARMHTYLANSHSKSSVEAKNSLMYYVLFAYFLVYMTAKLSSNEQDKKVLEACCFLVPFNTFSR